MPVNAQPTAAAGQPPDAAELAKRLAALPPRKRALLEQRLAEQGIDVWSLPVAPRGAGEATPLSFAQQRLWLLHQLDPRNPNYNLFGAVRLSGELDINVLEEAVSILVERHEVLRTHFSGDGNDAVQIVDEPAPMKLDVESIPETEPRNREVQVQVRAEQMMFTPFDLGAGPLLRLKLLVLDHETHVLLMALHHSIADAWSLGVAVREIAALYSACREGRTQALPDPPIQYGDFARWQRQWLRGPVFDKQLDYWRTRLDNAPRSLNLPTDRPRSSTPGLNGQVISRELSQGVSRSIKTCCQARGLTPYMFLLAAFQLLLHRWCGQNDICVGSSIANRPRPETENLIGFFVNTLVLRTDFSACPSVEDLLAQVREHVLGAIDHQDLPFDKLVEALRPDRLSSRHPFYQVLFVMQNTPVVKLQLPGVELESIDITRRFARFDLSLRVVDATDDGGFELALEYDADLFEQDTARQLLDSYACLVDGMTFDMRQRISEPPLYNTVETITQPAAKPANDGASWLTRILARADTHPDAIALSSGDISMTYRELEQTSREFACLLIDADVGFETAVGVYADRSICMVVSALAVVRAGGCFVPLDTAMPLMRFQRIVDDAGIRIIITEKEQRANTFPGNVKRIIYPGDARMKKRLSQHTPPAIHPDQLAYVMYTSGSSGAPKGVAVSHRALSQYVEGLFARITFEERTQVGWVSGVAADLGYTSVWGALCGGATLLVFDGKQALDADAWIQLTAQTPLDILKIAPSQIKALLAQTDQPQALLPRRILILGGEALDTLLIEQLRAAAPSLTLVNHYGPTETTIGVTSGKVQDANELVAIGEPFSGVDAWVLDYYGRVMPDGLAGELYIGGGSLARGYLGKSAQTAASFAPHPHGNGERLYRTGDRVCKRNGHYYFLGRSDGQLSLNGYRIEPAEVETVLRQLPEIVEAAVALARRDQATQLVAYIVGENSGEVEPDKLHARMAERLPAYMAPSQWVKVDALPLTANGKIDRQALPILESAQSAAGAQEQPLSETEQQLAAIWQRVLKIDSVGRHDNFFALGGDSILSLQVVVQAKRAGLSLTPKQLFDTPALSGLAALIDKEQAVTSSTTIQVDDKPFPLTPAQHWFFEQPLENRAHWNQSLLLSVQQRLTELQLRTAVIALAHRHDTLRLVFENSEQGRRQRYQPLDDAAIADSVRYIDIRELSDCDRTATIEKRCAELQSGFLLERAPLFRIAYFDAGDAQPGRLFIAAHHLLVDGVSWRILVDDLAVLYENGVVDTPTINFQTWSRALNTYASTPELKSQLANWRREATIHPLPRDLNGLNIQASGAFLTQSLSVDDTQTLLALNRDPLNLAVDDLVLAAVSAALCQWTGNTDALIECEGHGRELPDSTIDVSHTVGWFTARYPLYLNTRHIDDLLEYLRDVKTKRQSAAARAIDYGVLRYLADAGDALTDQVEPEVSYNYLGQIDRGMQATLWSKAPESAGQQRDPRSPRPRLLVVNAQIAEGRLIFNWLYSSNVHKAETIQRLAEQCTAFLESQIKSCQEALAFQSSLDFGSDIVLDADDVSRLMRELGDESELGL